MVRYSQKMMTWRDLLVSFFFETFNVFLWYYWWWFKVPICFFVFLCLVFKILPFQENAILGCLFQSLLITNFKFLDVCLALTLWLRKAEYKRVNIYINKLKWKGDNCSKWHLLWKCSFLIFLLKYYYITARLYNDLQYFMQHFKFLGFWISLCFCYCSACSEKWTNAVFHWVQYLLLISGAAASLWLCGTLGLILCLLIHIVKVRTLHWFSRQVYKILQRTVSSSS